MGVLVEVSGFKLANTDVRYGTRARKNGYICISEITLFDNDITPEIQAQVDQMKEPHPKPTPEQVRKFKEKMDAFKGKGGWEWYEDNEGQYEVIRPYR